MDKYTLQQYRHILREIVHLKTEKQRVLDQLLAPKAPDGMPHSQSVQDSIGNAVAWRDKYQRLIDARLDELLNLRGCIEDAITGLPPQERQLMRLRYIDGLRWEQIAVELNYSYRQVLRIHGYALHKMTRHVT